MKKSKSKNPSSSTSKRDKPNLFANDDPETINLMRAQSAQQERKKVMLRINDRTHVLVSPELATAEYAAKLRMKYKIKYDLPAKGGRRK